MNKNQTDTFSEATNRTWSLDEYNAIIKALESNGCQTVSYTHLDVYKRQVHKLHALAELAFLEPISILHMKMLVHDFIIFDAVNAINRRKQVICVLKFLFLIDIPNKRRQIKKMCIRDRFRAAWHRHSCHDGSCVFEGTG